MIVYAFQHNPFVHESADTTISLHHTKAGAWRALRSFVWRQAILERENYLRHGLSFSEPADWQRNYIEEIEVKP